MSDSPSIEQLKYAAERVLPDDHNMTAEELAQYLLDHKESVNEALREVGVDRDSGDPDVSKSADTPRSMLTHLYDGDEGPDAVIDPETAETVEEAFHKEDVSPSHGDKPPLAHFYGGAQPSSPGSSKGDYVSTDEWGGR